MIPHCSIEEVNIWEPADSTNTIAGAAGCSLLVAGLLEMRDTALADDPVRFNDHMVPELSECLRLPDLGPAAKKAAEYFRKIKEGDEVFVYGDYDVDGISATAIAMELALARKAHVRYYIPHRFNQGYGFHSEVARAIGRKGCDLLIIVDCGTQDVGAVEAARAKGIPVLVFDHHLVEGTPADCDALVNPQLGGSDYAKQLCAAAVVWCWAWQNELASEEWLRRRLELVALATIADCVSMSSPVNRALVRTGLGVLRSTPRPGLALLMEKLSVSGVAVDEDVLAMRIIPCLNAAGRLDVADLAVKVLFHGEDLPALVETLIDLNRRRRDLSTRILSDLGEVPDDFQYVHMGKSWSVGVLSSVASRLCHNRCAPVALAAPVGRVIRGTLRMPSGGDAVAVLKELSDRLESWGGHRLAAGFSVAQEKWQDVRGDLERLLSEVDVVPEKLDLLRWNPAALSLSLWSQVERLGPFGVGNPRPLLYFPQRGEYSVSPLGRTGKHVKVHLEGADLLGFGGENLQRGNHRAVEGWVYRPRIDTWRNGSSLQLILDKIVVKNLGRDR